MAFAATTDWDARTNGDAANGGGFDTASAGTDRTLQDGPAVSYTDIVIDGSDNTKATSAAFPFVTTDEGHVVNFTGAETTGDFTDQSAQIVSVAANVATFEKALGTTGSTGGVAKLGGAKELTQALVDLIANGNRIFPKNDGTYTNAINSGSDGVTDLKKFIIGYNSTHGDITRETANENWPLMAQGAGNFAVDNNWTLENMRVTTTSAQGFGGDVFMLIENSKVHNFSTSANRNALDLANNNSSARYCEAQSDEGNAASCVGGARLIRCYLHDSNNGVSLGVANFITVGGCVIERNVTGINFTGTNAGHYIFDTTFYLNGTAYDGNAGTSTFFHYDILDSNTVGISFSTESNSNEGDFNTFNNNGTPTVNFTDGANSIALDPEFVAPDGITYTDLVSNGASPSVISSVSRPFVQGKDEGLFLELVDTVADFTDGPYSIASIDGSGNATLQTGQDTGNNATGGHFILSVDRDFNVGANMSLDIKYPAPGSVFHLTIGALPRESGGGAGGGGMPIVGGGGIVG